MATTDLSNEEATHLLQLPKQPVDPEKKWNFPDLGQKIGIEMRSEDNSERFMLSATKSGYKIEKVSFHTRARRVVMLARLDLDPDGRHLNPDGEWILGPHLHLYRMGDGDRFAVTIPKQLFPDTLDRVDCWYRFLKYCNVTQNPDVRFEIFS